MPDRFLRLFFALPCPPPLAERIGRWRDDRPLPGRQVATANLHLTLAFLGQVPSARLGPCWTWPRPSRPRPSTCISTACCAGGTASLLAPSQPPGALLRLRRALRSGLAELELPVETRPFSPHRPWLAMSRRWRTSRYPNLRMAGRPFQPVLLAKRRRGVRYRTLGRWALCGKIQTSVSRRNNPPLPLCHAGYDRPPGSRGFPGLEEKAEAGTVPAQGTAKRFSRKDSGDGWQDAPLGPINLR